MTKDNVYEWDGATAGNNTDVGGVNIDEGCAPSGINNAIREVMAQTNLWADAIGGAKVSSGTDTVTLTSGQSIASYADGMRFTFIAGGTNTGAATLNVDSVGAKAIRKGNDQALVANDILAGMPVDVVYDASANSAAGAWLMLTTYGHLALYASLATLASTSNGDGAALIGIEDSATAITATTVEGALAEAWTTFLKLAGGTVTGNITMSSANLLMADNTLSRPKLIDYGETVNALGDLGGGTDDIDLESGNVVSATVSTATQTFTFSNPPASGVEGGFKLYLTNGGSQTVNWPASVDWAGGSAPTLTASGVDILVFSTIDGGTTWYGFVAGLDMQ